MTKPLRLLALLAVLLTACSDGNDGDGGEGGGTTTTAPATAGVSFSTDGPPVDLGDGWAAAGCEGDAPILCVTRNGQQVGLVELATFAVDSFELEGFDNAIADRDTERALRIIATDFVRTLQADRKDGCGTDYELQAIETEPTTVLGQRGLRYGYVGRKAGAVVERQVNSGTIVGDEVVLVNASA